MEDVHTHVDEGAEATGHTLVHHRKEAGNGQTCQLAARKASYIVQVPRPCVHQETKQVFSLREDCAHDNLYNSVHKQISTCQSHVSHMHIQYHCGHALCLHALLGSALGKLKEGILISVSISGDLCY